MLTMINVNQKVHLHPSACPKNPPMAGPTLGPIVPPIAKTVTYLPREWTGMVSPMTPPPTVRAQEPAAPAMNRKTKRLAKLGASAQARVKRTNRIFEM